MTSMSACMLQVTRMNTLLVELKRSMEELQLGLDGALNMSDKMEALARGIASNTVSLMLKVGVGRGAGTSQLHHTSAEMLDAHPPLLPPCPYTPTTDPNPTC